MITENYQLNDAKMFADISDGMAIVINSSTGIYYGMNGFGTSIFQSLISGSPVGEIIKTVSSIPGAPEDFPDMLNAFVNTLSEFEIVVPSDTASLEKPEIDANAASADGFIPECTEYKDVQELLFADPIHDVEEDKGWSPE